MIEESNGFAVIGRLYISAGPHFRGQLSPEGATVPGTVFYELYLRLEQALQRPDLDADLHNQIISFFDYVEVRGSIEVYVLAGELSPALWQLYLLVHSDDEPAPFVQIPLASSSFMNPAVVEQSLAISPGKAKDIYARGEPADYSAEYALAGAEMEMSLDRMKPGEVLIFGRQMPSPNISKISVLSRQHFEARRVSETQYFIRDLGSTNGSAVFDVNHGWTPIGSDAQLLNVGSMLRLGAESDGVYVTLPGENSYLLKVQAQIAAGLAQLQVNGDLIIGSSYPGLENVGGLPSEVLHVARKSSSLFTVSTMMSGFPMQYQSWDGVGYSRLDGPVNLVSGSTLILGSQNTGILIHIPGPVTTAIQGLRDYGVLDIGRLNPSLDLSRFTAISRRHAVIHMLPDRSILVSDSGSTNGTQYRTPLAAWKYIQFPVRVKPGSELMFGSEHEGLRLTVPR